LCLGQGADLHMAQLMPLPLTISCSSKFRLVLPFWCRLTWVVPDKIQCVRACVLRYYLYICHSLFSLSVKVLLVTCMSQTYNSLSTE